MRRLRGRNRRDRLDRRLRNRSDGSGDRDRSRDRCHRTVDRRAHGRLGERNGSLRRIRHRGGPKIVQRGPFAAVFRREGGGSHLQITIAQSASRRIPRRGKRLQRAGSPQSVRGRPRRPRPSRGGRGGRRSAARRRAPGASARRSGAARAPLAGLGFSKRPTRCARRPRAGGRRRPTALADGAGTETDDRLGRRSRPGTAPGRRAGTDAGQGRDGRDDRSGRRVGTTATGAAGLDDGSGRGRGCRCGLARVLRLRSRSRWSSSAETQPRPTAISSTALAGRDVLAQRFGELVERELARADEQRLDRQGRQLLGVSSRRWAPPMPPLG